MKKYIGIDPGQSGGIVVLNSDGTVFDVFKTPETITKWIEQLSDYKDTHCFTITEKVGTQPHHGGKSNFTFGKNIGVLLTMLEVSKIPFQEIAPATWMRSYSMKKDKGESQTQWKNRLKEKAQQLFPKEKVTLWNADAFLLAEYCRRNYA